MVWWTKVQAVTLPLVYMATMTVKRKLSSWAMGLTFFVLVQAAEILIVVGLFVSRVFLIAKKSG